MCCDLSTSPVKPSKHRATRRLSQFILSVILLEQTNDDQNENIHLNTVYPDLNMENNKAIIVQPMREFFTQTSLAYSPVYVLLIWIRALRRCAFG